MRRSILFAITVLLGLTLSGCLADSSNTLTVVRDPVSGTTTTTYNLTNDGMYYHTAAQAVAARQPDCTGLTSDQCTIQILALALADKGFVPRGMSGVEALASTGNNLISQAPVIGLGVGLYKLATRPSSVAIGDGSTYAPMESHITGSSFNDGNTVSIPYRYGSGETITELAPAQ